MMESAPDRIELLHVVHTVRGRRKQLQDNYFRTMEIAERGDLLNGHAVIGGRERKEIPASLPVQEKIEFHGNAELAGIRIFALADGVGGSNRGDLAAREAVLTLPLFYDPARLARELESELRRHSLSPALYTTKFSGPLPQRIPEILTALYQLINLRLHTHEVPNIQTTLVTIVLHGNRLYLANVGDSRVYRFPRSPGEGHGVPERLTVDDSLLDRKLYGGEYLLFAPCSYDLAPKLDSILRQDGRLTEEFVFDLTQLPDYGKNHSFEHLRAISKKEITQILSDATASAFRRAIQLGVIAPAHQIKDEGLLQALGHESWLATEKINCRIRQGERKSSFVAEDPHSLRLGDGDILMLCSDGLSDVMTRPTLREIVRGCLKTGFAADANELAGLADQLVEKALREERCQDNVTVLLLQSPMQPSASLDNLQGGTRKGRAGPEVRRQPRRVDVVPHRGAKSSVQPMVPKTPPETREFSETAKPAPRWSVGRSSTSSPSRYRTQFVEALQMRREADDRIDCHLENIEAQLLSQSRGYSELKGLLLPLKARLKEIARREAQLARLASLLGVGLFANLLLLLALLIQFFK